MAAVRKVSLAMDMLAVSNGPLKAGMHAMLGTEMDHVWPIPVAARS